MITGKFLGTDYQFPADILTFLSMRKWAIGKHSEMVSFLCEKYPTVESITDKINGQYLDDYMTEWFSGIANELVKRLYGMGIYAVAAADFLDNNKGCSSLDETLKKARIELVDAEIAYAKGILNSADQATAAASSQITGTGFGIITNSLIGYGVWAAMESIEIRKQEAEAKCIYKSMMDQNLSAGEREKLRRLERYSVNVWLPSLKNAVSVFIFSCFNQYIKIMIDNSAFQADALNFNDEQRAEEMLSNIGSAKDKWALLLKTFQTCPYCASIYTYAIDADVPIADCVTPIRGFLIKDKIFESLIERCETIVGTTEKESAILERIDKYVDAIAVICEKETEEIIERILSPKRQQTMQQLNELLRIGKTTAGIATLIRKIARMSLDEIQTSCGADGLTAEFVKYINTNILKGDIVSFYDAAKLDVATKLSEQAILYLGNLTRLKAELTRAREEEAAVCSVENVNIKKWNQELHNAGIFALSKKKELREKISSAEWKMQQAKENTANKANAYNKAYNAAV